MPPASRRSRHVVDDEEEEQRPRQRQRRADPEDEDDEDGNEADDAEQPDEAAAETADSQLIKKLVRYALACDFSRTPIRRDGIKDKVLGDQGRAFRRVFDGAQKTLRAVFGMEMVELPVKEKLTKEEKRKAAKSQNKSVSSGTYVLASILPEPFRSAKIIAPSRLLSADDEAAYVGFYTLIIALIRLNGAEVGELSDAKLKRYLARLNAETNTYEGTKTEETLSRMQKQGYLIKHVDKDAKQHGEQDEATRWYVGPRGKVEVTNEAIAGLVREVWGTKGKEEEAELEKMLQNSLKIKERDAAEEEAVNGNGDESRVEEEEEVENGGPSRRRRSRRQAQDEEEQDEEDE